MKNNRSASPYDSNYFQWQKQIGEFGGWANSKKFIKFIKPSDRIIDFGCGGGFLLSHLPCAEKIGIEINDAARKNASALGIQTYSEINSIPNGWADIIISNHALEHVDSPFDTLSLLYTKVRQGGKAVFFVPCESYKMKYTHDDINHHLYTWSPLNIGNLFNKVGFNVIESKPYIHKWPPHYDKIAFYLGEAGFEISCKIYGFFKRELVQIRIISERI